MVHSGACDQSALLRRVGGRTDKPAGIWVFDEKVREEQGRFLHYRVCAAGEEFLVACEEVMLPEVSAQPGPAGDPYTVVGIIYGRCAAPEVGIMMEHPPPAAVVYFCCLLSGDNEVIEHIEQRFVTLREVAYLGGPVIHLRVDVGRPLALPGWVEVVIPDALKVGRLRAGTRACYHQVAPELKVHSYELRVVLIGEVLEPLVRGLLDCIGRAEVKLDPAEQSTMVLYMSFVKLPIAFSLYRLQYLAAAPGRITANVPVVHMACRRSQDQRGGIGFFNVYGMLIVCHLTSFYCAPQVRFKLQNARPFVFSSPLCIRAHLSAQYKRAFAVR